VLVEAARGDASELADFLALADETPEIAGVVGGVTLTDPGLAGTLDAARAGPGGQWLVGCRYQVQSEPDPDYLARPAVHRGLSIVAAAGLVFDLVVRVDQLFAAARAARAVPELTFVLDHLGKPRIRDGAAGLSRWRSALAPLAAEPNVVAKLSGLVTEADPAGRTAAQLRPYVDTALRLFGPVRLMFGSDWPVCLLAAGYADVLAALDGLLPAADRDTVQARTAIRVYHLDKRE
jgi:L-fuconolactonase